MRRDARPAAAPPRPADPLQPFEDALRARLPSREELLAEARAQTQRRRGARQAGVAAVVLAAVGGLLWADPAWHTEVVRTAVGEQRRETLHDGSGLVLNTASELHVEYRLRSRRFVLDHGEVAFQVVHGWRPFTVRSGDVVVRDIGTAFTMRRHGQGTDVVVLEGAVEVRAPGRLPRVLTAGEAVTAGGAERMPLRSVDVADAGAWRDGRLVFDGTPLAEVLAEVARYRRAPVVLDDPRAGRLRLSGAYDLQGLEALIDALPQALPVTVRRTADGGVHVGLAEKK